METTVERFRKIFAKIRDAKIGLYGDFCVDSYWILDPRGSEISLETGLQAQAISSQKYLLGGASNVAANVAALKPKELHAFGVYGDDIFGKEMISQLNSIHVNTNGMVVQNKSFNTYAFSKLILDGVEQPRIDFGTYNKRSHETDSLLLSKIKESVDVLDIFIINQQVPGSITNQEFIKGFNKIINDNPDKIFIIDSRHFADKFKQVSYKVNNFEAARLTNSEYDGAEEIGEAELKEIANELYTRTNRPVFITRGDKGIIAFEKMNYYETPGIALSGELDIVGAGDTVLSAIACALGAGSSMKEAIELANLAASVTVQKLYQTGTANENEIIGIMENLILEYK
jgi:rfaE bifunctional protein kinase chain/domain